MKKDSERENYIYTKKKTEEEKKGMLVDKRGI